MCAIRKVTHKGPPTLGTDVGITHRFMSAMFTCYVSDTIKSARVKVPKYFDSFIPSSIHIYIYIYKSQVHSCWWLKS